jgi:predicted MFS family arabinose efflux permease
MIAACSHSISMMIMGRALQGAGAVGSTIIAMLADLTRENQRTKAMAMNGMTIGVSFSLAMILGPIFAAWIGISGIFWLATALSFLAIFLLFTWAPTPQHTTWHREAEPDPAQFMTILKHPELARLNSGIFLLHALFTASFVVIPISLQKFAGLSSHQQWKVYVPTLLLAFIFSIALIVIAEKKRQLKRYFMGGILLLGLAECSLLIGSHQVWLSALGLLFFFTAFSLLEAFLPSWISRAAPPARKGTALGIYSCSQFLGIFVGGTLGGWLYGAFGLQSVFLFCILLSILWLAIAFGMKNLQHATSRPQ